MACAHIHREALTDKGKNRLDLWAIYAKMDPERIGQIASTEFGEWLESIGVEVTPQETEAIFGYFDQNGNGAITYGEFANAFFNRRQLLKGRDAWTPNMSVAKAKELKARWAGEEEEEEDEEYTLDPDTNIKPKDRDRRPKSAQSRVSREPIVHVSTSPAARNAEQHFQKWRTKKRPQSATQMRRQERLREAEERERVTALRQQEGEERSTEVITGRRGVMDRLGVDLRQRAHLRRQSWRAHQRVGSNDKQGQEGEWREENAASKKRPAGPNKYQQALDRAKNRGVHGGEPMSDTTGAEMWQEMIEQEKVVDAAGSVEGARRAFGSPNSSFLSPGTAWKIPESVGELLDLRRRAKKEIAYATGEEWEESPYQSPVMSEEEEEETAADDRFLLDPDEARKAKLMREATEKLFQASRASEKRLREIEHTPIPGHKMLTLAEAQRIAAGGKKEIRPKKPINSPQWGVGKGDKLIHKLGYRSSAKADRNRAAEKKVADLRAKLRIREVRQEEHKYEVAMANRLQVLSQGYSRSVEHLVEVSRQLKQKSDQCDLAQCVVLLPRGKHDPANAADDKVNKYLKLLARRSQFSFSELRKMFIDCRKHSKHAVEVCMDKQQFGQIMKRYGYSSEKISNHLFEIFDADHSQTIDFDEMVLGLASLRPESMETNAERFFKVIDLQATGQVSRLGLVQTLMMLNRAPNAEVVEDVTSIFRILKVHSSKNIEEGKFVYAFKYNSQAQEILRKYLAVYPNKNLLLSSYSKPEVVAKKGELTSPEPA